MGYWDEFKAANGHMTDTQKNIFRGIAIFLGILLLKKIWDDPRILITLGILIISVMLHEIAHGLAAYIYGDDTAKKEGRLTLNPLKHLDPVGTALPAFLILTGSTFVIGWAKPVPVNFYKIKKKEEGLFVVSIAGILVNLLLAFIGASIIKFLPGLVASNRYIFIAAVVLIRLNVTLAVFNLLPIPPLDGSKVLASFGNKAINNFIFSMEKFGVLIIFLLMWTGLLQALMSPLYSIFYGALKFYMGL